MQYTENESYFCPDLNKEVVVTLEVIEHRTSQTKDGRIDQRKKFITGCSVGEECGAYDADGIQTKKKCVHPNHK